MLSALTESAPLFLNSHSVDYYTVLYHTAQHRVCVVPVLSILYLKCNAHPLLCYALPRITGTLIVGGERKLARWAYMRQPTDSLLYPTLTDRMLSAVLLFITLPFECPAM